MNALSVYAVDVPSAPHNASVVSHVHGSVKLTWLLSTEIEVGCRSHPLFPCNIEFMKVGVSNQTIGVSASVVLYIGESMPLGLVVRCRVRAVNEVGHSAWTSLGDSSTAVVLNVPSLVQHVSTHLTRMVGKLVLVNTSFFKPSDTGLQNQDWSLLQYTV